jgi:UDPglucose--hexose-1-phosphate uridylyltransferase
MLDLNEHSHRRLNPLTGEWVVVSPHRTKRPWKGQVEPGDRPELSTYDPYCYLCPGNNRAADRVNPAYSDIFVFDNDFPALRPNAPSDRAGDNQLLIAESERGICRVICFSPDHSLTLSRMQTGEIRLIVDEWSNQYIELGSKPFIEHVQIFENRGEMMGASNPHPHCQIWASESIPNESVKELHSLSEYSERNNSCLLCDYLAIETASGERIVCENDHFLALVPFWAVYPFESMLLSKRHLTSIDKLGDTECDALAEILKRVTTRYDNLFETPFPYSMGFHQAPTNCEAESARTFARSFLSTAAQVTRQFGNFS